MRGWGGSPDVAIFDRRPFVTGLENPRSSIVTCFLDEFGSRDNEIRAEGEGMGWDLRIGLEDYVYLIYICWNDGYYLYFFGMLGESSFRDFSRKGNVCEDEKGFFDQ